MVVAENGEKIFTTYTGDINDCYRQLASMALFQAAKDYVHYRLSHDYTEELHTAEEIRADAMVASTVIRKRLEKNPEAIDECRKLLTQVIANDKTISSNEAWLGHVSKAERVMEVAKDKSDMVEAVHQYVLACTHYMVSMGKRVRRRNTDIKSCEDFFKSGNVELYSGGLIETEALMALMESKIRKKQRKANGKRSDNQ